ncbi:MAG: aminotransferase class V-fold PLP-dependent enzyme [Bacteroidales bacterium]|nr:aminotransferase class V-fold PLP-dependent enzyme [Bacteroidales bacterium]
MNQSNTTGINTSGNAGQAFSQLEKSIFSALERYSNVHRGSGHFSKASTHLYEKAREIVLEYLGLEKSRYQVIFLSPRRASVFSGMLKPGSYQILSGHETGLSLGVDAVIAEKAALPEGTPFETGGGTTKLYGADWVLWAGQPDRFEAGTPAIINVIAFARALQLVKRFGKDAFSKGITENPAPREILYSDEFSDLQGNDLLKALRDTMVGHDVQVPTTRGPRPFINLDNSASTPSFRPAWEAFRLSLRMDARAAMEMADEVRQVCAGFLDAPSPDFEILFTSNTTESINLAAAGLGNQPIGEMEPVILTTVLEHSSNDLPWRMVPGHTVIRLDADKDGILGMSRLDSLLSDYNEKELHGRKRIRLVTVSGASNVLGTCNDLQAISDLVHRHGALLMVDAAQLAAHRKISMAVTGIDLLALSAHKMYAPFGTGVLVARRGLLQFDETEADRINASGEANPGGIAAMGKAMLMIQRIGFDLIEQEERSLTNKALKEISGIPAIQLHGMLSANPDGLVGKTGVIGFSVKSMMPATVARMLALSGGMGVRFGCLCSHLIIKQLSGFTPFQEKFQRLIVKLVPVLNLQGIIRASFGIQNTEADVEALVAELKRITSKANGKQGDIPSDRDGSSSALIREKVVKSQLKEFIAQGERLVFG